VSRWRHPRLRSRHPDGATRATSPASHMRILDDADLVLLGERTRSRSQSRLVSRQPSLHSSAGVPHPRTRTPCPTCLGSSLAHAQALRVPPIQAIARLAVEDDGVEPMPSAIRLNRHRRDGRLSAVHVPRYRVIACCRPPGKRRPFRTVNPIAGREPLTSRRPAIRVS